MFSVGDNIFGIEEVCYSLNLGYKLVRSIANKTKVLFEMDRTNYYPNDLLVFCFVFVRLITEECKVVNLTEKVTKLKQRIHDIENQPNVTKLN